MQRRVPSNWVPRVLAWLSLALVTPLCQGAHSLCLDAQTACFDFVDVKVTLGAGPEIIIGAQVMVTYDPAILQLVSMRPGNDCDPTSPFSLQVFGSVDEPSGHAFIVAAVNPFVGQLGTAQMATVACLRFLQIGTANTEICVEAGDNPTSTLLSDNHGLAVAVDNSLDCPGSGLPRLSCDTVESDIACVCTPDSADCGVLDSDCQRGVCNAETGLCFIEPTNEGGQCDDGAACTTADHCVNGVCRGSGCVLPSLCVEAEAECRVPQGHGLVRIKLGDSDQNIIGAQFSVQFDAGGLQLISVQPGANCDPDSPFSIPVTQRVDNTTGEVFYAVSTAPGDAADEATTLACLTFQFTGFPDELICLFDDANPALTILVTDTGDSVPYFNADDCPSSAAPPTISCDRICTLVPAVSDWGVIVFTLTLLVIGKITFANRLSLRST